MPQPLMAGMDSGGTSSSGYQSELTTVSAVYATLENYLYQFSQDIKELHGLKTQRMLFTVVLQ